MAGDDLSASRHELKQSADVVPLPPAARLNDMLLASLPHPAMLVRGKDKVIVAANKMALNMGVTIGDYCWRSFSKESFLSKQHRDALANFPNTVPAELGIACTICQGETCLTDGARKKAVIKAFGKTWDMYWIPADEGVYLHYAVDITEFKTMEKSLRRKEDELRGEKEFADKLLEAIADTVFVFEWTTGKAIRWNKAFRSASGYNDREIAKLKAPDAYYSESDLRRAQQETQKVLQKGKSTVELSLITKGGQAIPFQYSASVVLDAKGAPRYLISIGRNLAAYKQVQEEKAELAGMLAERVKELNCLYTVLSITEIPNFSLRERFERIVNVLRAAWQYPAIACARIELGRDVYQTGNYRETPWKISADLWVRKMKIGSISVCYLEERPEIDEGPFLLQEKSLLFAVSEGLGRYIERIRAQEALKESEEKFRTLSIIDSLTQLYNSRHFYAQLQAEMHRATRYKQPLTLILFDIDGFKAFNDTYGHEEGNNVLVRFGSIIKSCLRKTDSAYRYGGEEFTILLPVTKKVDGVITAERLKDAIKDENVAPPDNREVHLTISMGIGQYQPSETIKEFVHRVDQLMYRAKQQGRDRICLG